MPRRIRWTGRTRSTLIIVLMSAGLWQLATAGWIQGKAFIAQQLLNHSWNQVQMSPETSTLSASIHKPWPWADTWPVAKLIVPQQAIEQIILAGDSGSSLAFGPGYSLASATPNSDGTTVISGHRDTHFRFLTEVKINDIIYLQTPGEKASYQVYDIKVVDSRTYTVPQVADRQTLVLTTCAPADGITPGGPLRHLVFAGSQIM